MCSAKRKNESEAELPLNLAAGEPDWLYANLSSCLHAMGQPLTVLRCTVAASAAQSINAEKLQKYLRTSAEQVTLLCGLFDCLRGLVDSIQSGAERSPVEVSRLFKIAVDEQTPLLQASGLTISMHICNDLHSTILADMNSSLTALSSVIKTAASVSAQGDVIDVQVSQNHGRVQWIIQNVRAHRKGFTPLERLNLAVAEASVRSQGGDYACTGDPFYASLTLPDQSPAHNRVLNIAELKGNEARYRALEGRPCS